MNNLKTFKEFIDESYLEKPTDVEILDYDKKKMKKNGYIEALIIEPIDDLKKDDKVLISDTEIGQLDDNSLITCYKDDKEFIVPKKNLKVEI